ncbi:hypothetical protein B0J17DRAFT_649415 [Rhizoctonia solani]|nr:hypothetical protein B0J17DRAFT_649415 [Rhizoctonia solani]
MKLAPILLAAPVVFTLVAADPRPTAAPDRRVLDRWRFARQDETASGGTGGGAPTSAAPASTPTREATSASPTSVAPETTSTPAQPTTTSTSTTPQQQPPTSTSTSTSVAARPTSTTSSSTPVQQSPTSNPVQSPSSPVTPSANPPPVSSTISMSTPEPSTAVISTTDGSGRVITSVLVITQSPQSIAVAATASSTADEKSTGISPATTIGLAVTGSIAGLLVILLIVWKLTNKRFSDLEDGDDDAIKWPELHKDSSAMTPIPARPTPSARAETDTLGTDFDRQSAAHSTADLQYPPYSDDPGYGARPAYYDPYGGAPAEAQYYDPARVASPGPNAIARGMSPGPGMAYDARVASPAPPNVGYADQMGRTGSPGPAGYGYPAGYAQADPYGGRNSPGPNMAYGQPEVDPYGRRSPGPGMAYNGSVGRVASPGPGAAYR